MKDIEDWILWLKAYWLWPAAYRIRQCFGLQPKNSGRDREDQYSFETAVKYWTNVPRAKGGNPLNTGNLTQIPVETVVKIFEDERRKALKKKERRVGFETAREILSGLKSPRVLDYGSGFGFYGFEILDRHPESNVTFADIQENNLRSIQRVAECKGWKNRMSTFTVRHEQGRDLHFDQPFDFMISMGVLHHTPYASEIVRRLTQYLKPGGLFQVLLYNPTYRRCMERITGKKMSFSAFGKQTDPSVGILDNPYSDVYDEEKTRQLFYGYELVRSEHPHLFYDIYQFRKT
ncbi:MAG: hypothetical protein A2Z83_06010 [Omnitrophica bacterium GWA2_52_8]|nr:MAG: hypothetical protein A2Z83_06010 [Omnitrophica bacterium GWA2_52_8]